MAERHRQRAEAIQSEEENEQWRKKEENNAHTHTNNVLFRSSNRLEY